MMMIDPAVSEEVEERKYFQNDGKAVEYQPGTEKKYIFLKIRGVLIDLRFKPVERKNLLQYINIGRLLGQA